MKNNLLFLLLSTCTMNASIVLPGIISDGMVIQRNSTFTLWGWASPKETITVKVSWSNTVYEVVTGPYATWQLSIPTGAESVDQEMTLSGYNTLRIQHISLGDVWFCSGQSNMEMSASWGITDGDKEIALAHHPLLYFFSVPKATASYPQDHLLAKWEKCTPETMKYTSAVAYFFGRRIQELNPKVPIGLVVSAWGGTAAEEWLPKEVMEQNPIVAQDAKRLQPSEYCPHVPSLIYNAMIHPLTKYALTGFLWYQGESNMGSTVYEHTLTALIQSWRQAWQKELPFYIVQLAPYYNGAGNDAGVVIRNAQRIVAATVPATYLTVISDVAETNDIHPKDKKSVGVRLANTALIHTYRQLGDHWQSPAPVVTSWNNSRIVLTFPHAKELHSKGSLKLELGHAVGGFQPVEATIQKNTIVIATKTSYDCLRFAWDNDATATLFNENGLPVSSFLLCKP